MNISGKALASLLQDEHSPSSMLALGRCTQHGNIWHNDNVILGTIRQFLAEDERFLLIETDCSILVFDNSNFFPSFAKVSERNSIEKSINFIRLFFFLVFFQFFRQQQIEEKQ